jgi:hypothetical protein
MERAVLLQDLFTHLSNFSLKISLNEKFFPSLKGPTRGVSLHVPQRRGPYGNRRPIPEPYLAYFLGSPVKELSLQFLLIELPRREMPQS